MEFRLSPREKMLLFIAFLALVFLVYWYLLLQPLLANLARTRSDIAGMEKQLEQITSGLSTASLSKLQSRQLDIFSKDKQLDRIVQLIDQQFKRYNINLISLKQSSSKNIITIDLRFKSSYYALLTFLNSLSQLNTLLAIDTADLNQEGEGVVTEMRIFSAYQ